MEINSESTFVPIVLPVEFQPKRNLSEMILSSLTLKPINFSLRYNDFYVRKLDYNNKEPITKNDFSGSTVEYNFIYY